MSRRNVLVVALVATLVAGAIGAVGRGRAANAQTSSEQGTVCIGTRLADLDRLFDTEPAGIVGADYQRATELPDGRVFWTFQDGAIRTAPDTIRVVHNIAAIQDGPCFTFLYRGTRSAPRPFLFADATEPFRRWFWPMGATVGADGAIQVFTAELRERSDAYLVATEPVATRLATIDPATMNVVWEGSPANSSADLYGWSVTSDAAWTYLYAQCYRQFGYDLYVGIPAHDRDCGPRVTVGRVPRGDVLATPEYWDGGRWQPDPGRAAAIVTTVDRIANANQFLWTGGRFVSVNHADDWWGDTVFVSTSTSPTGPFVLTSRYDPPVKCADCNTFFASWMPDAAGARPPRTLGFGWSNNRWDGVISAQYRPSFGWVDAPVFLPAGGVFRLPVPADAGVPVISLAAVRPTDDGFVTVFPCGRPLPTASNLNFSAGETVAALALVRPDAAGEICIYSEAETDLVVDTAGSLGDAFVPEPVPRRLVDTRDSNRVDAGEVFEVEVPDAVAVALNVTAVRPSALGFVTVFPCGGDVPTASNLNVRAGENVANLAVVRPGERGRVCVYADVELDLVVDLAGTFGVALVPEPTPRRLVDTRSTRALSAGDVLEVPVPAAVGAVLNVAAVRPTADGYLTVFPCGADVPTASNLNFRAGANRANLSIVRPGAGDLACVYTSAGTDLIVDLSASLDAPFAPTPEPVRLADTRLLP